MDEYEKFLLTLQKAVNIIPNLKNKFRTSKEFEQTNKFRIINDTCGDGDSCSCDD